MIQRFAVAFVAVAVIVGLACVDMSAPSGAASISPLQLPSPSVVVGDSMRDSNGVVTPVTVIAYDGAGIPIDDIPIQIFVTDTTRSAHLTPERFLVGDTIGMARLVGQVNGLQTQVVTVPVTYAPAKLVAPSQPPDTARPPVGEDSAHSLGFSNVSATVRSAADSASQGIIVRFTIQRPPAASPSATSPTVYFDNGSGVESQRDTSDASGTVSRRLVVNARAISPDVAAGTRVDSAVVRLDASYKGVPLTNSPLFLVVPIRGRGFQ